MKWQRTVPLLLSLAVAGGVTAGCSESASSGKTDGKGAAASASPKATDNKAAAVQYPAALTYWVSMDSEAKAVMQNYGEMELYKQLEKITGTKVTFQHPSGATVAQQTEQFNLLLASGRDKLPDVLYWNWQSVPKGPDNAIKEKTIIRLNELIDQNAPNLSKYLKEHPEMKKQITSDEGNIFVMPYLNSDYYSQVNLGPIIRKDWLDKLGLQLPATIDDWHNVLTAIKTKDPNGNGKNDEIPLLPSYWDAWSSAWGVGTSFYQENGQVKYGPIQPAFKDFLATMRKWYDEGLIDKDYAATDGKLLDSKMSGDTMGTIVGYVASGLGKYLTMVQPTNPKFDLAGAPFPVLKAGDKNAFGMASGAFAGYGAAITSANKHPEETVRWLDYAYGPEGHLLYNFGVEGASYKIVNGNPIFTDDVLKNGKLSVTQALSKYTISPSSGPFVYNKGVMEQVTSLPQQVNAKKTWMQATGERIMPGVTPTTDESSKLATIMNDVNTYYKEMINKFVMGVEPIDKFESYVKTIQGMGIDDAVKIEQAALDRFNKR
ncbi:MAG: extracellular solute-binding protein [Paenibacillaceae bacterium]|nr:extracellular solute-binding protein [Paenibacillaceae bacterium]